MQDLCDQMLEVFEKNPTNQESNEILENQSDVFQASPIILKSNMLEDAPTIQIAFEDQRINKVEKMD